MQTFVCLFTLTAELYYEKQEKTLAKNAQQPLCAGCKHPYLVSTQLTAVCWGHLFSPPEMNWNLKQGKLTHYFDPNVHQANCGSSTKISCWSVMLPVTAALYDQIIGVSWFILWYCLCVVTVWWCRWWSWRLCVDAEWVTGSMLATCVWQR